MGAVRFSLGEGALDVRVLTRDIMLIEVRQAAKHASLYAAIILGGGGEQRREISRALAAGSDESFEYVARRDKANRTLGVYDGETHNEHKYEETPGLVVLIEIGGWR